MNRSKINSLLTLEYIVTEHENKYFDRKSAKVKPVDLASLISAFANADGGTIVIGVSDKKRTIEGVNSIGEDKLNDLISSPKDTCKPTPKYEVEFLDVVNQKGETDRLLLLHICPCIDQIIQTCNDSTFLRIADRTRELKGADLRNLEYSKSTRYYEDECHPDAVIEDLDEALIEMYKEHIDAKTLTTEQLLRARGFLKNMNGKPRLTNAAVLLFARNIRQFYPNCRVRFVRYQGDTAGVGTSFATIKDVNIEYPIMRIIEKSKEFITSQLRDFTALDTKSGRFQTAPEYPEFAWVEGVVNAVTHREYGMAGAYILVAMYDERLEIQSPGKLPNLVTVDNIRETRFSRNPQIARVLTEMGWVRELNKGSNESIQKCRLSFWNSLPIRNQNNRLHLC